MSDQLWCVHIEGLGDFIATDSQESAEREASAINAYVERFENGRRAAAMRAVVIAWPFTAEGHARALECDWEDLQRMPHRRAHAATSEGILTNIARRVKELIEVARGV